MGNLSVSYHKGFKLWYSHCYVATLEKVTIRYKTRKTSP